MDPAGRLLGVWSLFMDPAGRPLGVWSLFMDPAGRPLATSMPKLERCPRCRLNPWFSARNSATLAAAASACSWLISKLRVRTPTLAMAFDRAERATISPG